jgi:hypothetical protein
MTQITREKLAVFNRTWNEDFRPYLALLVDFVTLNSEFHQFFQLTLRQA